MRNMHRYNLRALQLSAKREGRSAPVYHAGKLVGYARTDGSFDVGTLESFGRNMVAKIANPMSDMRPSKKDRKIQLHIVAKLHERGL